MNPLALEASPLAWILGLVAIQRLIELTVANRNTAALLARGGREVGAAHYPLFLVLHASWLVAIALTTPWDRTPNWVLVAIFAGLQGLRIWVVATLGTLLDDADHHDRRRAAGSPGGRSASCVNPNYWVVCAEIAILPLAFGNWPVALIWSGLNAALLSHRIRIETQALKPRETT